jgi:hypothetical protein
VIEPYRVVQERKKQCVRMAKTHHR